MLASTFPDAHHAHAPFDRKAIIGAALVFWLVAYAILTVHALLDPTSSGQVLSHGRLLATATGAALLLALLRWWDVTATLRLLVRIKLAVLAIGAACALMYGVRLILAHVVGDFGATEFADGGRWVIAWAGYFAAALSASIAWRAMREVESTRAMAAPAPIYECADDPFASVR